MSAHQHHAGTATAPDTIVRDPVCGMTVDPDAAKPTHVHEGRTFHFCSERCRGKFVAGPEEYLTAKDPVCGMQVGPRWGFHQPEGQGLRQCSPRTRST